MKFVDLFAGLGGFHAGLVSSGGYECVFACENNTLLRKLYESNFGLKVDGDIRMVDEKSIPEHDLLCAGFPCQPFSLAGFKKGAACPQSGRLVEDVLRIAKHTRPEFLILENVPGLLTVEKGEFWKKIVRSFENLGYRLIHKIISPEDVGIPQNRRRLFVVGSLNYDLTGVFDWKEPHRATNLNEIFNDELAYRPVEPQKKLQLKYWQELLSKCSLPTNMPCLTISAQEFGANYPMNFSEHKLADMKTYHGAYGCKLSSYKSWPKLLNQMPNYCRKKRRVPVWLEKSVKFSREIYKNNEAFLDGWCAEFNKTHNSWQLLEWRGQRTIRNLESHIIQFRASGIRIQKADKIPSLVSMTRTQVPIIGWKMRYISKYEAITLQNLQSLPKIPENDSTAFKAIGNAVNAKIVELIATKIKELVKTGAVLGGTNGQ